MYLTLEVVSPQAASLGADRRRVVGQNGLTIGRVPGNDWVIPDPYISKQHARITFANGSFFVESLGRNAIAIGSPGSTIPGNQPRPLRNGDRLFIDQYEMAVTTMQGDPPGAAPASDDPFAVLPATPGGGSNAQGASGAIPDMWNGNAAADLVETGVIDPIDVLGGARPAEPAAPAPVNWQRASVLESHFEPPPVRQSAGGSPFDLLEPSGEPAPESAPPAGGIPDNWDRTNMISREPAKPAARSVRLTGIAATANEPGDTSDPGDTAATEAGQGAADRAGSQAATTGGPAAGGRIPATSCCQRRSDGAAARRGLARARNVGGDHAGPRKGAAGSG